MNISLNKNILQKITVLLIILIVQLFMMNVANAEESNTSTKSNGFIAISAGIDSKLFDIYKIHLMNSEFGIEGGAGGFVYKGIADETAKDVYNDTGIKADVKLNVYTIGIFKKFNIPYIGLGYTWLKSESECHNSFIIPETGSTVDGHGKGTVDMSTLDLFGGISDKIGNIFYDIRVGYRYGIKGEGKFTGTGEGEYGSYTNTTIIDNINWLEGVFGSISIGIAF